MLTVPPLRNRVVDIPQLVDYFARKFAVKNRRVLDRITAECMDLLTGYSWPGNVRELENAIERGIILMRGSELTEKSLPLSIQKQAIIPPEKQLSVDGLEPGSLFVAEKQLILKTLEETGGNKSEAARRLGITRKTLLNKLNRYEVE
jgi:two-component system, NtrC family, response regulator HydG